MRNIHELFNDVFRMENVALEDGDCWSVEKIIEQEVSKVLEVDLEIDDLCLTAYASNTYDDPRIHGWFRFCVYGGIKYPKLKKKLESMKSPILKVMDIYHPEQTVGISFNGVYEDDDTTYIGGNYELRKEN